MSGYALGVSNILLYKYTYGMAGYKYYVLTPGDGIPKGVVSEGMRIPRGMHPGGIY